MKKNILIIIFIFIISMSVNLFYCYSNADSAIDDMIVQGRSWIKKGQKAETREGDKIETIEGDTFKTMVGNIYNILLIIGIVISVIISAIIGIKMMVGSVEEKAEIKEQMIPYIVGCAVMFGAFAIWKIAMIIAGNIK